MADTLRDRIAEVLRNTPDLDGHSFSYIDRAGDVVDGHGRHGKDEIASRAADVLAPWLLAALTSDETVEAVVEAVARAIFIPQAVEIKTPSVRRALTAARDVLAGGVES